MRILVAIDTYVPSRISGALQMHDFTRALRAAGHRPLVLVPAPGLESAWRIDDVDGIEVLRVRAPRTKGVGLVRRAVGEALLSWALLRGLRRSPLRNERFDGVVWYSPTIFLGPLAARVRRRHGCRGYLILRDLFPDWAVDAGILRRGLVWRGFKLVERYQYRVADTIGVQTPGNLALVERDAGGRARLEVLPNWLAAPARAPTSVRLDQGPLAGRTTFAYTGNMGAAQAMDAFLDLAEALREERDIGFLFVGRGSDVGRLRARADAARLDNVLFVDEVDACEIPGILAQAHVGLIALDPRHTTHNIPGKLITYLHAGLPVLARINAGNDLHGVVVGEDIGRVCVGHDCGAELHRHALELARSPGLRRAMGERARALAARDYSPERVAAQVCAALGASSTATNSSIQ